MKETKLRWALGLFLGVSFGAMSMGCDDSDDVTPDAAVVADAAADVAVTKDGPAAEAGKTAQVGAVCQGSSDCGGPTDFCAKSPANPTGPGQCTKIACDKVANSCPTQYPCTDVSRFAGSATPIFICVDPKLLPNDGGVGDGGSDANRD